MQTMMSIMVFGQLSDITNGPIIHIEKVDTTDALLESLYNLYPLLKQRVFLIAVDKKICNEKSEIGINSHIALLPPFSGG